MTFGEESGAPPRDGGGLIYVAGKARGGTTLVGLVLGMVDDHVFIGEGKTIWDKGLRQNFLCNCGTPFRECPFWSAVMEEAHGGMEACLSHGVFELYERVIKKTSFRDLHDPSRKSQAFRRDIDALNAEIAKLHAAIRTVSGKSWIVDTSKYPHYALMLSALYGPRLKLVHLIRDPRGIAFSRTRVKAKPDARDPSAAFKQSHPLIAALRWVERHREIERLGRQIAMMRVIYEDFVRDPAAELAKIFGAEQVEQASDALRAAAARRPLTHAIAGNPHRFDKSGLVLKVDDEWKTGLGTLDRLLVQTVAFQRMREYGYRWSG